MPTPPIFHKYQDEIITEMKSVLVDYQSPLFEMMRYHLGWIDESGNPQTGENGKLLRPTLCLLACEAIGGVYRQALPAAAAVELVHNFSLIHDDIQDHDRERHHRPTVWAIWGMPQAINAGTGMRILANQALFRLSHQGINAEKLLKAGRLLDLCTLQLLEGQYLDISFEHRLDVSVDDYLEMVRSKTAVLIATSLELGAMVGCEQDKNRRALYSFGIEMGLAFQIMDDLLGIWGEPQVTGKSNGNDILRKKKSFPVVYALENSEDKAKKELGQIYQQDLITDNQFSAVLDILESSGAQKQAQRVVDDYLYQAGQALQAMDLTAWGRQNLQVVLDFLANRDF